MKNTYHTIHAIQTTVSAIVRCPTISKNSFGKTALTDATMSDIAEMCTQYVGFSVHLAFQ